MYQPGEFILELMLRPHCNAVSYGQVLDHVSVGNSKWTTDVWGFRFLWGREVNHLEP